MPSLRVSPEPASPSPSTPSSGSPPPDETYIQPSNSQTTSVFQLASQTSNFSGGGSPTTKRRLPGGSSFAAASNTRDAKSRRREEAGSRRTGPSGSGGGWAEGKDVGKREKEDLVDIPLAEYLRKEFGDPFIETAIKNAA